MARLLPEGGDMTRLIHSIAVLAMVGSCSWGKVAVVFRLASPPLPVEAGQHFGLCAANVGTVNVDLTLQFINVRTGAIVATREVILPPPGLARGMPDPCLNTTSEAVSASIGALSEQSLLVALVVIKRGLFSRVSAATASVQVTVADAGGGRRMVASIPLHLATLINGRNTPIERVQ
jgi:hypothetical protein